jgi:hypothetical protein
MYYFSLQYKMLNRHIKAFGLPIALAYVLAVFGFALLSYLLFIKVEFAAYLYVLIGLVLISKTSETNRNDFLKTCFTAAEYRKTRLVENLILSLPFITFLIYQLQFIEAIILLIGALSLAFINFKPQLNLTLPTPFSKKPFEFLVGFRKTFVIVLFAYFLVLMAIKVDNFNLGAFSFVLIFGLSLSYYGEPEKEFFVWIFAASPKQFLLKKLSIAFQFSMLLSLPIISLLISFFIDKWWVILLIPFVGYIYLAAFILLKYVAFPREINIPQVILFVISIAFPPFLLILMPYFYNKAIKSLLPILGLNPIPNPFP